MGDVTDDPNEDVRAELAELKQQMAVLRDLVAAFRDGVAEAVEPLRDRDGGDGRE